MRRRRFITSLAGVAVLPVVARAQQTVMPVIGLLSIGSPKVYKSYLAAFRQGLNENGYVEGQNVAIEYRWGNGDFNRMPALTTDLVDRQVDVIAAGASTRIAKAATTTIPVVGFSNGDPVKYGLVASFNRPGGNVTVINLLTYALGPKRFELLRELLPKAKVIAVLANPNNPDPESKTDLMEVEVVARRFGQDSTPAVSAISNWPSLPCRNRQQPRFL
jgi:putative tryptophan/tyrosine transport system substrate-binding protein